jgi:hypothetical protein
LRAELLTLTVKSWTEVADDAAAMLERTARFPVRLPVAEIARSQNSKRSNG